MSQAIIYSQCKRLSCPVKKPSCRQLQLICFLDCRRSTVLVNEGLQSDSALIDPEYLLNSLVAIDGGTGASRLTMTGTEFEDSFTVQDEQIYGAGLGLTFTNIAHSDVTSLEGNDEMIVLSTKPPGLGTLYGSLGSDTFTVTPQLLDPVASTNLRGHGGIVEHEISSASDPEYDGLMIRGIHVNVLDNDGDDKGYISVVDQMRGYHLMSEDGFGNFTFQVFPTRMPMDDVFVSKELKSMQD